MNTEPLQGMSGTSSSDCSAVSKAYLRNGKTNQPTNQEQPDRLHRKKIGGNNKSEKPLLTHTYASDTFPEL